MQNTIVISFPGNAARAFKLAKNLACDLGTVEVRDFSDGEAAVRIDSDVNAKNIILVCELDHPNDKILPLMFMTKTLRELGAKHICLVAPYLPYMQQNSRFYPGEALAATQFTQLISDWVDSVVTVGPHFDYLSITSQAATPLTAITMRTTRYLANWITKNVASPFIIGFDDASEAWVADVARRANTTSVILQKNRLDDGAVSLEFPDFTAYQNQTPVLIDEVISTGTNMLAILAELKAQGFEAPICVGVHALFNDLTHKNLLQAGAKQIVSCATVAHVTNKIDICDLLEEGVKKLQLE